MAVIGRNYWTGSPCPNRVPKKCQAISTMLLKFILLREAQKRVEERQPEKGKGGSRARSKG